MIERQVFGPDVGEQLYQALRFAPSSDLERMSETSTDSGIVQSQGMKTPCDCSRGVCAAREKASK